MTEQSKIARIDADSSEQGHSTPSTIDLSKDVLKADPDNPDAPAVMETRTETFEIGEFADILLMELGAIYSGSLSATEGEFVAVVWDLLSGAFTASEFRRFKKFAVEVDAKRPEILSWVGQIIGVITSRPTEGQPNSPAGLPATPTGSTELGAGELETPAVQGSPL